MALMFADSCDHYDTSTLLEKWANKTGTVHVVGTGRNGNGLSGTSGGSWFVTAQNVLADTPSNVGTCVAGCAFFTTGQPSVGGGSVIQFGQWGTALEVAHDGSCKAVVFSTLACTSPSGAVLWGGWTYLELKVHVNGTTTTCTIFVNGVQVATGNVTAGIQPPLTEVDFGDISGDFSDVTPVFDDFYILDGTGPACNDALGNIYVQLFVPNANGNVNDWAQVGSGPTAGQFWENVDEIPPDDDGTYLKTSTLNDQASEKLTNPGGAITGVAAVQIVADMKQDGTSTTRAVSVGVGNGSAQMYDSGHGLPSAGYKMFLNPLSQNPFTSADWLASDLTGLEAAVKLTT